MNLTRIKGIILRHLFLFKRSWERVSDSFYWPAMDIVLWGLTSLYIQKSQNQVSGLVMVFLTGLIFWQVVWRGQYELTVNLLEELWNQNMVNVFCSPLKLSEWVTGMIGLGFIKMLGSLIFAIVLTLILYTVNLFSFGWLLIPFLILLLMSGWWVGLLVSGAIVRFGRQIQTLAWAGVFILAPFSAIYYPVSALPFWAQIIARMTPISYIFEGMRKVVQSGKIPIFEFLLSFILNLVYLVISVIVFRQAFAKSKELGLSRLDD